MGRLCADDADLWSREGIHPVLERCASALDEPCGDLASISAAGFGLLLGHCVFLEAAPYLGLVEGWKPVDAGLDSFGAVLLGVRSGGCDTRAFAGRIFYAFANPAGAARRGESGDRDRISLRNQAALGVLSLDRTCLACVVSVRDLNAWSASRRFTVSCRRLRSQT